MINILNSLIEIINKNLAELDINLKVNKDFILIGPESELESIIVVTLLASIEDDLRIKFSIETDLFEIINKLKYDNITIENLASELN